MTGNRLQVTGMRFSTTCSCSLSPITCTLHYDAQTLENPDEPADLREQVDAAARGHRRAAARRDRVLRRGGAALRGGAGSGRAERDPRQHDGDRGAARGAATRLECL